MTVSRFDPSPSFWEQVRQALPEVLDLRTVFYLLLGLAAAMVALDYRELAQVAASRAGLARTGPLPLDPPTAGDQVRPYLPKSFPVGPDRGEPTLPGYSGPLDPSAIAEPMKFVLAGEDLSAVGRIEVGTAENFRSIVEEYGQRIKTLHIHSPGGSVTDAIEMARLVREKGLATAVPDDGYCASACPLLFSGGVTRTAGAHAWIGVHQVYSVVPSEEGAGTPMDLDRSISQVQDLIAECQQLLVDMGIEPALWIKAMRTPPEALYVLTPEELSAFSVTTADTAAPLSAAVRR
ncbi:hypothetical protein [Consotaella salsifontis]|uniref:ATP-dependent Clp protease proteolytic subunit n=1 Tax=Consotaella salsifontis TaxID=1365950 RepID=A0A1T4MC93_9HYPH|nr:hypothetical protein [Consotaella salsifontis]SJZ64491.1 hypothetical protein SAMN05428963_10263 [Consotaella salsifontis]